MGMLGICVSSSTHEQGPKKYGEGRKKMRTLNTLTVLVVVKTPPLQEFPVDVYRLVCVFQIRNKMDL